MECEILFKETTHVNPVDRDTVAVSGDLPNYLAYESQEPPETVERLARLLALAREKGWRQALDELYTDQGGAGYVTDTARAAYLDLIPFNAEADVLEIGASMAQHTSLIAPRVKSVRALEVVPGQARFAAERCRQEGLDNVSIAIGGDDCTLPYENASFDCVVLNLVFEWCGSRLPEGPAAGQERLLSHISRVLRPGGMFWLATKNRYALRLLLGGRDEHLHGCRIGSALPRFAQAAIVRTLGKGRAPGLLHSYGALRHKLERHGFGEFRSFWGVPDMRYPTQFIELTSDAVRAARREGGFQEGPTRLTRTFMPWVPAPLVKHFTPGLAFLAVKQAKRP
jgi:SAM-dependent methyltransferase